jgi:hypothetical protein
MGNGPANRLPLFNAKDWNYQLEDSFSNWNILSRRAAALSNSSRAAAAFISFFSR